MKNKLTIWCTYHKDSLLDKFEVDKLDSSIHKIYATHKDNDLQNMNYMSKVINEACTMYYVWKNQIKSEYVGFEHYCRHFNEIEDITKNQCQVGLIAHMNIKKDYFESHKFDDYLIVLDIIKDIYGENSKYYIYMNSDDNEQIFIPWEMFIMHWDKFNELCNFIFSIYFEFDKRIECNLSIDKYLIRYNYNSYEMRAFYIERLISCFIACNFDLVENPIDNKMP